MQHGLPPNAFSLAFPFHITLNSKLEIVQLGSALQRIYPQLQDQLLADHFQIRRPLIYLTFEALCTHQHSIFLLESLQNQMRLKGQMLHLEEAQVITFLCSPWITELAEIGPLGLSLSDFAIHDPISDYLLLLQSKHAALQDTKRLAQKVTAKQEILRDTNDKLHQEIAERIRIEAALAQARDQAFASSRLKSEFLATMSHELRTPMNGIMGMGELLLDTELDDEQRDYANVIYQEAEILLGLLNDILDFSKIEAGKLILEESEFTLATVIDSVTSLLRPQAQEKGLAFIAFIAADLPKRLIGDATRLRQIIVNLVSNAIKFTEQGEVVVEIKRANHEPRHLLQPAIKNFIPLQIVVRDTGIGIAQAMQTRLFASFVQADSSTTRKYGGTGLGLAITKRLVDLMQGSIAVHSELGKGSVFTTTLSLLCCESEPESASNEQWRNLRTLLVSTDHEQINTIKDYLATWKIQAETIARPDINNILVLHQLHRATLAGHPYTLVLVDEASTNVEALSFIRSVRMDPLYDKLKLILLTLEKNQTSSRRALEAGFNGVMAAPVQQSMLFNHLLDLLSLNLSPAAEPGLRQASTAAKTVHAQKLILVVEDHENNQRVALARLRHLGYAAHVVPNGLDAVNAITSAGDLYKLILMDWQMPIMDGIEATQTIRNIEAGIGRRIPIIGMTANAMKGDREKCLAAGMDDYISKPVSLPDLRRVLEQWTTRSA